MNIYDHVSLTLIALGLFFVVVILERVSITTFVKESIRMTQFVTRGYRFTVCIMILKCPYEAQ